MQKIMALFFVLSTLSFSSVASVPRDVLTFQDFFKLFLGDYSISRAGGLLPPAGDETGHVEVVDGIPDIRFPYCSPDVHVCDMGERDFTFDQVVNHEKKGDGHDVYTFEKMDQGMLRHYAWDVNNGAITFYDYQYKRMDGVVMELVFQCQKARGKKAP